MDGTGILFGRLLTYIKGFEVLVIPLPNEGPQDYISLSGHILKFLPDEEFILVAESFSGGIAAIISQHVNTNLKGIILSLRFYQRLKN